MKKQLPNTSNNFRKQQINKINKMFDEKFVKTEDGIKNLKMFLEKCYNTPTNDKDKVDNRKIYYMQQSNPQDEEHDKSNIFLFYEKDLSFRFQEKYNLSQQNSHIKFKDLLLYLKNFEITTKFYKFITNGFLTYNDNYLNDLVQKNINIEILINENKEGLNSENYESLSKSNGTNRNLNEQEYILVYINPEIKELLLKNFFPEKTENDLSNITLSDFCNHYKKLKDLKQKKLDLNFRLQSLLTNDSDNKDSISILKDLKNHLRSFEGLNFQNNQLNTIFNETNIGLLYNLIENLNPNLGLDQLIDKINSKLEKNNTLIEKFYSLMTNPSITINELLDAYKVLHEAKLLNYETQDNKIEDLLNKKIIDKINEIDNVGELEQIKKLVENNYNNSFTNTVTERLTILSYFIKIDRYINEEASLDTKKVNLELIKMENSYLELTTSDFQNKLCNHLSDSINNLNFLEQILNQLINDLLELNENSLDYSKAYENILNINGLERINNNLKDIPIENIFSSNNNNAVSKKISHAANFYENKTLYFSEDLPNKNSLTLEEIKKTLVNHYLEIISQSYFSNLIFFKWDDSEEFMFLDDNHREIFEKIEKNALEYEHPTIPCITTTKDNSSLDKVLNFKSSYRSPSKRSASTTTSESSSS